MYGSIQQHLQKQLEEVREQGLEKRERKIQTPQNARVLVAEQEVLNLCANNYLGLADHPRIVAAAKQALEEWGFGMASVRFICGTQTIHHQLEQKLSDFLGMEETILYSSCFDANGGLFETLLTDQDAVISDSLNHASIIDGIRLCKAQRFRYKNNDMHDLEEQLKQTESARFKLIATDGVFSMDGYFANLQSVCDLAEKYDALVMVDDSHAVGFVGENGRGTHEHCDVMDRVDIITGTLGKALGGASGGYTAGRKEIIDWLRQRSRPYLFSNSLAPPIVAAAIEALDFLSEDKSQIQKLKENTIFFRTEIEKLGFTVLPGEHPIVPIMLGDAALANSMADELLKRGVYVTGFSFPVVPKGEARIRTQMSAAHSQEDLQFALKQFAEVKAELKI
ncbi:glycine C-acetyltransferase [Thalassoglobus polymorphus]|uniref:2-amino-3-ketobutyrate coenzyme A ligase n=1 Tax=Thalassoglobus polymorphus TaxID=2527994 RepID=A0A517QQ77_9PLAN|nr:glycine C-acetyltransferase [Thalassoglobus polymorphus]QDT33733.1 2-amino-3-ketobutyrate coenzyme A ligase [Thalassoglobus polymorphus]